MMPKSEGTVASGTRWPLIPTHYSPPTTHFLLYFLFAETQRSRKLLSPKDLFDSGYLFLNPLNLKQWQYE
jgi:hypothetical protein